eukprot:scaffold504_cov189-Ochromonas_danica.AAC.43
MPVEVVEVVVVAVKTNNACERLPRGKLIQQLHPGIEVRAEVSTTRQKRVDDYDCPTTESGCEKKPEDIETFTSPSLSLSLSDLLL